MGNYVEITRDYNYRLNKVGEQKFNEMFVKNERYLAIGSANL